MLGEKERGGKGEEEFSNQDGETESETLPIVAVTHFHILLSLFCEWEGSIRSILDGGGGEKKTTEGLDLTIEVDYFQKYTIFY